MPQLDVSTFASQIFWLAITFSVLYYLLSKRGLPRLEEILEARQDRIAADLDEAQRMRSEAERALESYEAEMSRARAEAHRLVAEAQEKLSKEAADRQRELDTALMDELQTAQERIAEARAQALKEIEDVATVAAQAATERLSGAKVTKRAAQTALRQIKREAA